MRFLQFLTITALLISTVGCPRIRVEQKGKINMISTRNVETDFDYILLRSYAGGAESEIKGSRAKTLDEALDQTVKNVPGGEFLMNAVIFLVKKGKKEYFAIQGDVWGREDDISYRGLVVGDRITFKRRKKGRKILQGVIIGLKDSENCYVQLDGESMGIEVRFDQLVKSLAKPLEQTSPSNESTSPSESRKKKKKKKKSRNQGS